MKICILPGVGFQTGEPNNKLIDALKGKYEVSFYDWSIHKVFSIRPFIAQYINEVLMDFQIAILKGDVIKVPEADVYLGHSAGALLALTHDKPVIIMGCPLHAVLQVGDHDIPELIAKPNKKLNIVNKYDFLSSEIDGTNTKNYVYKSSWLSQYMPWLAHTDYWNNKEVVSVIENFIQELGV